MGIKPRSHAITVPRSHEFISTFIFSSSRATQQLYEQHVRDLPGIKPLRPNLTMWALALLARTSSDTLPA